MSPTPKILLVDDDPAVTKGLEQLMPSKGYAVVVVSSGEEALWQLANSNYAAVISAINLPGISGLELVEAIRAHKLRLPVAILSADDAGDIGRRVTAAGATELWGKHLSVEQLSAAADRLLQSESKYSPVQRDELADIETDPPVSRPIRRVKNVLLFLFAPFFALGYVLAFPFIGLGMLGWWASRHKEPEAEEGEVPSAPHPTKVSILGTMGKMLGVVLFGIVFAVVGPLLGVGLVLWFGFHAWGRVGARAIGSDQAR